jgi:hypothetical protein
MSDLAHLDDLIAYQDRGAEMVAKHPVTGEAMPDIVLTIAGPDSDTARRARLTMQDELQAWRSAPPAQDYDKLAIERLARCVVAWRVKKAGADLPFTFSAVVKMFTDMTFLREQADRFAADRTPYLLRTPLVDE